jgi:hypothetical protein
VFGKPAVKSRMEHKHDLELATGIIIKELKMMIMIM